MTPWHVIFPICAVIPALVNTVAVKIDRRHSDALGLSLMILAVYGVQRVLAHELPIPERQALNPILDVMGGLAALGCWVSHRRPWVLALTLLYAAQCAWAACFWWGWEVFSQTVGYGTYVRLNNVLWLLSLVCVAASGGYGVARSLVDRLHRSFASRHRVGLST